MDHLRPIFHHFFSRIFNVAAWATVASGIAHQLDFRIGVLGKCTVPVPHRPQAFPASASSIAVANYDPDLHFGCHPFLLYRLNGFSLL
jgi:hypothetical protein